MSNGSTATVPLDLPTRPGEPTLVHGESEVVLSASVYDVPQSATIEWNGSERVVLITFKYVDNEKAIERRLNDLTLYTGKNSDKLIAVSLKVTTPDNKNIAEELARGVDRQIAGTTRDNQRLNYKIVRDILYRLGPVVGQVVRVPPAR